MMTGQEEQGLKKTKRKQKHATQEIEQLAKDQANSTKIIGSGSQLEGI